MLLWRHNADVLDWEDDAKVQLQLYFSGGAKWKDGFYRAGNDDGTAAQFWCWGILRRGALSSGLASRAVATGCDATDEATAGEGVDAGGGAACSGDTAVARSNGMRSVAETDRGGWRGI